MEKDLEGRLVLSTLPKTWIFDLDGTILRHNGHKTDGGDAVLPGAREYLSGIPDEDKIIILTSRAEEHRERTLEFLKRNEIPYDAVLFGMPMGERIVVNDRKPSGLDMAVAVNIDRDHFTVPAIERRK